MADKVSRQVRSRMMVAVKRRDSGNSGADVTIPYSRPLEARVLPDRARLEAAARALVEGG